MLKEIRVACVRDPIHDYIYFTESLSPDVIAERDIINTPWVQRLRRIFQLQASYLVYPGATHTRFQHSLGVMQLAGNLARKLYDYFRIVFPDESIPEKNYVEEVFRLAGLLHDIGHGPFGHLLDDVYTYPRFGITHEDITYRIIEKELSPLIEKIRHSPNGKFQKKITASQLIKFIKVPSSFENYELWEQIFAKIMLGPYSVDIIDFLLRDKYYCGTKEFGSVDMIRLLDQSIITRGGLSLQKNAIPAFKGFLSTRLSMFRHIYFHEKKDLFEATIGFYLPRILELMGVTNVTKNLKRYYFLDDFSISSTLIKWSREERGEKRKLGKIWEDIVVTRTTPFVPVLSGEKVYTKFVRKEEIPTEDAILKLLKSRVKFKCDIIAKVNIVDVRLQNQFVKFDSIEDLRKNDNIKAISIYDPHTNEILGESLNNTLEEIPVKYMCWRVFVQKKYAERVKTALKGFEDLEEVQLHLPLSGIRWDESKSRTEISNA